jgi:multiple sugar transport system ATP-binding protein
MAQVVLEHVEKVYDNGYHAVHDLNLEVRDGEFLVLVGPSGCGKSTALRMVAGLENITSGKLIIGDRLLNDVASKDRDIAMVFQNYALYPHMTVRDNIAFALKLRKTPKAEIDQRVGEAARILELTDWLDRKPAQLSGGQRQRVAMGRAIVRQPSAFLMDEPLSNLDAKLRVQMRAEISKIQHDLNVTTIYVTHDQTEAMTMGHRVAVMSKGFLQQVDTPQNLYDNPDNLFVAAFIGSPQMNLVQAVFSMEGPTPTATIGEQVLPVPPAVIAAKPGLKAYNGKRIVLGIRPEHVEDASLAAPDAPKLTARVDIREGLGSEVVIHTQMDAVGVKAAAEAAETDESVAHMMFTARLDPRTRVVVGDQVQLAVEAERMHFFDAASGLAIRD